MKCSRCRVDNTDDAQYCRGCGSPLGRPSPGWAQAGATPPTTPPAPPKSSAPPPLVFDPNAKPSEYETQYPEDEPLEYGVSDPEPLAPSPSPVVSTRYGETPRPTASPPQNAPPPPPMAPPAMMGYAPTLHLPYASIWLRFVASLIDGVIKLAGFCILSVAVGVIIGFDTMGGGTQAYQADGIASLMLVVLFYGMDWLYDAYFESSSSQATPGKIAMGLRVTDLNGLPISFGRATGRHFGKILSSFLCIGFIMAAFTEKKQALHDMLAGCLVVSK